MDEARQAAPETRDGQGPANTEERTGDTPDSGMSGTGKLVLNQDVVLIWGLRETKEEIARIESEREWLRDRMYSTGKSLGTAPGGGGFRSGFDEIMARLSETDEKYKAALDGYLATVNRAEKVIRKIESTSMRRFVRMVYKDHADRRDVLVKLKMSEWGYRKARESIESARNMSEVRWKEKFVSPEE